MGNGIGEYKNPIPVGWAVVFFLTIVWAIWYFLWGCYPLNSILRIGEYNEEVAAIQRHFEESFKKSFHRRQGRYGKIYS